MWIVAAVICSVVVLFIFLYHVLFKKVKNIDIKRFPRKFPVEKVC